MKRSFFNFKPTMLGFVLGTALMFGACNNTTNESGSDTTATETTDGMISETTPVKSMVEYFDESIAESKLTVVDFYTDWCGPCKRMDPFIKEVKAENSDINVLQVNAEDYIDISQRYNLEGYPTLIFFKDGQIVDRALGYMDKEGIMNFVNRLK